MSSTHAVRPRRRSLRFLAGTAATALVAGGLALLAPQVASAAADLPESGLYATVNGDPVIYSVDRATGAATPFITSPGNVTGLNQLGVSGDGKKLFFTNGSNVFEWTAATETFETTARPSSPTVAAQMAGVDPKSGRFFFGGLASGTRFTFLSYNPDGNTFSSQVVSVTAPGAPGNNGDLAFDRQGNMYFISSSASLAQVYRVNAADLGGGSTTATAVGPSIKPAAGLTSLAFGDDGYIYITGQGANTYLRVNPVTGVAETPKSIRYNGRDLQTYDLGSRALPSTGQSQGGFTDGRAKPADELTTTISGGDITTPAKGTTSPGNDTVTVGPIILLPGQSYTVEQTPGNAGTNPNDYDTSYVCTNLVDNTTVSEGKGTKAPFTVPAAGGDVQCVFSNPLKPTVENNTSTGNKAGGPATVDPLKGSVGDIDPTTLQLTGTTGTTGTVSDGGKTLTVPGEGVWTVDPSTGKVTFTPEDGFTKNPTPVTYTVSDERGNQTSGQAAVTYAGNAQPDTAETKQGSATTIDVLKNDQGGTVATSVVFPVAGQPDGASVSADGKTLTVPGQGSYVIDPATGVVTFTPEPGFRGTAKPVTYQVADADGATSTATITVTVTPVGPKAGTSTTTTEQNTPVTIDVTENATPGVTGGTPIDPTSVVFPTTGQPDGAKVTDDGKTLTVPGEGVYTIDPDTGKVTFTPAKGYTGTTTPISYQVSDTGNQTGTGTLTTTVTAVAPTATADNTTVDQGGTVTTDVLTNDTAGNENTPLEPTSVVFPTTGQPDGAKITDDGKTLTVPGQGVWTIDPTTGKITLTTDPTFRGTTTPVTYQVADTDGTTTTTTITATVTPVAPEATDDTDTTEQNTPVTVDVLDNDGPGVTGGTPINPASVVFPTTGQPTGATTTTDGKQLTVPGEGVYTIDPTTGKITFTPAKGHTGTTTPVTYQVADTGNQTTTATLTITITKVTPTAKDDTASTPVNTPVTVSVLGNDRAGNTATPIDVTKVRLLDRSGTPVTELRLPGTGTFTVDQTTGEITFAPATGFSGTVTAPYRITDVDGGTSDAVLTVVVGTPPTATADTRTGKPNTPITVDVIGNDGPGSTPIDPSSVKLVDPTTGELVDTVTIPGEGTYVVGKDGSVTFTPEHGFAGTSTVDYSVAGEDGSRATATLTITIPAVPGITTNPADGGGIVVTTPGGERLAFTGTELVWPGSIAAGLLIAAGIALTVIRRRRNGTVD